MRRRLFANVFDLNKQQDFSGLSPLWRLKVGDYSYIFYSGDKVAVCKGDSLVPSYKIDSRGCNCPSSMYSGKSCKHVQNLTWLGDGFSAGIGNEQVGNNASKGNEPSLDLL